MRTSASLTEGRTHGWPSLSRYAPTTRFTLCGASHARKSALRPRMPSGGPIGMSSKNDDGDACKLCRVARHCQRPTPLRAGAPKLNPK
eukprot:CAMPEP_0171658356 /NCGR_PEP_ID=MMETSP0990-20121206/42894_1 /TAXON_ID=483369 /ORGANISM="non described non described, Strain CCMP2098" /LENGTH=87 /DNA_ID=CAMNT_0012239537 /DNA_START=12 /DNA_END=272 /DNA_ORIENTATION=-